MEINSPAKSQVTRRDFLQTTVTTAALASGLLSARPVQAAGGKPALLGGVPVHSGKWPAWPISDEQDEAELVRVLRSGNWFRYSNGGQGQVAAFEQLWAKEIGTPYCQATNSGTSALVASLAALEIGPGDEVLVPTYTFVATINCVLLHHALPVFVDSDPETAQMDARKIEERINENTRAILPAHIGGGPCEMDQILDIARRRSLKVVEDACQAQTASWKGQRLGSLGDFGCFSFQNSKNMTSGDGGALATNDRVLYARARAFQNNGSGTAEDDGQRTSNGCNIRLTEFQGAVLLGQLRRNELLSKRREEHAASLDELLSGIMGIRPKRSYEGTTRHGYHLYILDFDADHFAGMTKAKFVQAMQAEGIPLSSGYTALNRHPAIERFLNAPGFKRIYSEQRLHEYREQNRCPANDLMLENTCCYRRRCFSGPGRTWNRSLPQSIAFNGTPAI